MKKRRCAWCGKKRPEERRFDVAGVEHWFHVACWLLHLEWMTDKS
jgi:hypothetical protein